MEFISKIEAGLSPVLYHWTTHDNAVSILEQNKFKLTNGYHEGDHKDYYYLSTSRAKFGGYHVNKRGVIFTLDGKSLGQNYKGSAFDYYHKNPEQRPSDNTGEQDEMEDRVLSKKPTISQATKYIKEIHVCTDQKDEPELKALAAKHNIPIYMYSYSEMLSWLNMNKKKANTKIAAGLSSILYHWTPLHKGLGNLTDNAFTLSQPENAIPKYDPNYNGYRYLSTTRSKHGGYHVTEKSGVVFVLDGNALKTKYKGKAFDYWHNFPKEPRPSDARTVDEMEDRIISKDKKIPLAKYTKEIHVMESDGKDHDRYLNHVTYEAKKLHIPCYLYKNENDWHNLNKKKARETTQPEKLAASVTKFIDGIYDEIEDYHFADKWLKIKASSAFKNWVDLTDEQIGQEYEWEYISHQKRSGFNPWPTLKSFKEAVKEGTVETLTEEKDHRVGNRSRCEDIEELKDLTSGYQFPRDVDRIVEGYKEGHPMPYPILLEQNGKRWVMSGNTRLDAAFIMGITPKVLILKVPSLKEKVASKYRIVEAKIQLLEPKH